MSARIFKPSKTAMQSGKAKSASWVLEFDPEFAKRVDPLMGWTSSSDTQSTQVRLAFETKEQAIAYAKNHGIPHQVFEPTSGKRSLRTYADNFKTHRRMPWTH